MLATKGEATTGQTGGVNDMMSNLSIMEGAKSSQPVPQTRAPAVTRRSTFQTTDKDDEQASGDLDEGGRSSEMSAQDKKDLKSDTINYDAQKMIGHGKMTRYTQHATLV